MTELRVKALEWRDDENEDGVPWLDAATMLGHYEVFHKASDIAKIGIQVAFVAFNEDEDSVGHVILGYGKTVDEAKALAQSDYATRILSAVEVEGVAPVAALKSSTAIPDGMVLVPREPTEAMIRKAMERLSWWTEPRAPEYENGGSALIADGLSEEDAAEINAQLRTEFLDVYAVLLSASPTVPASSPAGEDGWQDISTAPEGTEARLLYCDGVGERAGRRDPEGYPLWVDLEGNALVDPTHWRERPAPPPASSDGAK